MTKALDKQSAISRLDLTRWLLRAAGLPNAADELRDDQAVFPLDDGAMGSFALVPSPPRGKAVAEADYEDEDGVEVLITLFVDDKDQPVEVDFWKVDFAPTINFPSQNQLKAVRAIS